MNEVVRVEVDDRDVMEQLGELKDNGVRRIARKSLNAGTTELRKAIAAEAPPGSVRKSVGKRVRVKRSTVEAKAGVNVGKRPVRMKKRDEQQGKRRSDGRYAVPQAVFIAAGTKKRRNRQGSNRGLVRKNDFVRRGSEKGKATAAVASEKAAAAQLKAETQ